MKERADQMGDSKTFLSSSSTEVTHFKQHLIYSAEGIMQPRNVSN